MKKRLLCLLLVLVTALALCVSAAAAAQTGAQLNYVTDAAGLLREGERARLEKMAEAVSQKYRVGVYIVTVEDFRDYHADGVYKATYTIYHNYTMGEGPSHDREQNGRMALPCRRIALPDVLRVVLFARKAGQLGTEFIDLHAKAFVFQYLHGSFLLYSYVKDTHFIR